MSSFNHKPASPKDLGREARDWDLRMVTPRDWHDAPEAIPRVGASTTISLRMPAQMLAILKAFAKREGIGYQVLMKRWLDDRIREERDKLAMQQVIRFRQPKVMAMAASFAPQEEPDIRVPALIYSGVSEGSR